MHVIAKKKVVIFSSFIKRQKEYEGKMVFVSCILLRNTFGMYTLIIIANTFNEVNYDSRFHGSFLHADFTC